MLSLITASIKLTWSADITLQSGGIYLLKVYNRNTRARCEICSELTIKLPERHQWHGSGVFIVNFEHISHAGLLFLLLTLNMWLPAGKYFPNENRYEFISLISLLFCFISALFEGIKFRKVGKKSSSFEEYVNCMIKRIHNAGYEFEVRI